MTEEEILAMKAGPGLNAEVASQIMDIKVEYPFGEGFPYYLKEDDRWTNDVPWAGQGKMKWAPILPYSTDISAAWLVWLAVTKDEPEGWAIYSDSNGEVSVEHYPDDYKGDREAFCGDFRVDGLFPEAICKAALLAKLGRGE